MNKSIIFLLIVLLSFSGCMNKDNTKLSRPKLVVGIVIDQMRWDYLYRYYDLYGNDGFKRMMDSGFNCENTMLNYLPEFTGPGHSCIYTGSVPSIHGIAANDWKDNLSGRMWYCVEDTTVHGIGSDSVTGPSMSPRNLLTTTVTDELRLATNLRSRVYGVAIKDRGSILPAGHLANAAYWYDDKTGYFVSSSYYANPDPQWLKDFNKRKLADSLVKQNWKLLYSPDMYIQSLTDANAYEGNLKGEKAPVFPHIVDTLPEADKYNILKTLPAGNTLTFDMARACINGEQLGQQKNCDFLCVSLSSTDYAGHLFAPNSIEVEDMYLRLDKEIAAFLDYLDNTVGRGNYTVFLTADHGAAHNAKFLTDLDVPAGSLSGDMQADLNSYLKKEFNKDSIIDVIMNYQIYLNNTLINSANLDKEKVKTAIREWMGKRPEVEYLVDLEDVNKTPLPQPIHDMVINGYYRLRSGSMQIIPAPEWYDNNKPTGTTHGTWNPYDSHIPLLWYGWHIPKGETHRTVYMTDIAPTVSALLNIQMPNGCVGKVITEIVK
ncbi:MAG TPA: alkaline phosphatase PafA [Flavipsychrobacter sp.]|nr:alkaline phosphatase PafA [Flavipsychrobacter sp.]